ncbi:MAG: CPBP family glutamic-type intramembrane protease [Oscillospiraceae bacterium]|nr:CPBP family glutamic-type intramembrane protease [Oscillospiraceae bacterium]
MNLIQALYTALSGIVYGLLYVRFRKLWLCILAHAVFNTNLASWLLTLVELVVDEITLTHIFVIGSAFSFIGAYIILKQPAAQPIDDITVEETSNTAQLLSHVYH